MTLIIPAIRTERVRLTSSDEQKITMHGRLDMQYPKQTLGVFLKNMHEEICRKNARFIHLNITDLSYVNSASIREFLTWLLLVQRLPEAQKYDIYVFLDPEETCQISLARSLALLYNKVLLFDISQKRIDPKTLRF